MSAKTTSNTPLTEARPAVCALVPPGQCQFGSDKTPVPLLERKKVSHDTSLFRFGLPDPNKPLNLATCACLLVSANIPNHNKENNDVEEVTRPYTPISTNADVGYFDLMIKRYDDGLMSKYLHDDLDVGKCMDFWHIDKNVKLQAPFDDYDTLILLAGGTGITPMIQALHAILGDNMDGNKDGPKQRKKVVLLYGSKTQDDILAKPLLDAWAKDHSDQFTFVNVLSEEPDDSSWKGPRGFINRELVEKYVPDPTDPRVGILVCGPPPLYNSLCGPRDESDKVTGFLGDMGCTAKQVYKF